MVQMSSIYIPNLSRIDQSVQKLLMSFQNLEIRSRDSGHATSGSFYNPYAGMIGPLCLHQTWSGYLYSLKSY